MCCPWFHSNLAQWKKRALSTNAGQCQWGTERAKKDAVHPYCRKAFKQALTISLHGYGRDEPWNRSMQDIKSTDETSRAYTQMPRLFICQGIRKRKGDKKKSEGGEVIGEQFCLQKIRQQNSHRASIGPLTLPIMQCTGKIIERNTN